ncbi:hypothetical protein JTB14_022286 [Gonioctena quinquepunctata]|nr:hypothetical protein JTB14_022286 [Gonioctena quinquepunctata]
MKYKCNDHAFKDPTDTIESRYKATLAKTERLRALGYEVIEKECNFRKELSKNLELHTFSDKHPFIVLLPLGVSLCVKKIEPNPVCRQIDKSFITSFWGKLGQRKNQQKTCIVNDIAEFFDILLK